MAGGALYGPEKEEHTATAPRACSRYLSARAATAAGAPSLKPSPKPSPLSPPRLLPLRLTLETPLKLTPSRLPFGPTPGRPYLSTRHEGLG